MNIKNNLLKGHLSILLADIIFGLNAPVSKAALEHVSAMSLTTFRMTGAALSFLILSLFLKKEQIEKRDKIRLFFASLLGVVINQGFFVLGLSYTTPVNAAIVTTTLPIVTMLCAALFLREPISGKKVAGVLLGASGALILILGNGGFSFTGSVKGDLYCLIAQISVAVYLTLFKDLFVKYSPFTVLKWLFCYASLCFLPFSWNEISNISFASLPGIAYAEIAFVVFAGTFLSYLGMMISQKFLRPTVVSIYNYVQPVVASIVAVWVGMDSFGPNKILAVLLVFSGVYFVTLSKSREQVETVHLHNDR